MATGHGPMPLTRGAVPHRFKNLQIFSKEKTMKTSTRSFVATISIAAAVTLTIPYVAWGQASISTGPVISFLSGAEVAGASATLVRNSSGVTASFHTSQLKRDTAYTFWLVIFNNPENCSAPCNEDDIFPFPGNVAAMLSIVNIGGHVVGGNGRSNFGGRLNVGDTSGALFGPGLVDPLNSLIFLVLRSHGNPISGMTDQQISLYNGGCPPNECIDEQISIHAPGAADSSLVRLSALQAELDKTQRTVARIALRLGIFLPAEDRP